MRRGIFHFGPLTLTVNKEQYWLLCLCKTNPKCKCFGNMLNTYMSWHLQEWQKTDINVHSSEKSRLPVHKLSECIATNLINVKANMEIGGQVPVSLVRFLNERHEEIWRAFISGVFNSLLKSHTKLGISWKTVYKKKEDLLSIVRPVFSVSCVSPPLVPLFG